MEFLEDLSEIMNKKYTKTGSKHGKFQSHGKNSKRKLVIYVHNLKYDIWALLKPLDDHFKINPDKTMIIKSKIIRLEAGQFIFRDSLVLTGLSLERSGIEYDIEEKFRKKSGDWDYEKIRTPESILTPEEIGYAVNDVLALEQILRAIMKLHQIKTPFRLPPTKTGFVRKTVKRAVLSDAEHVDRMKFENTDRTDRLTNRAYHGGISDISRHDEYHYGKGNIGDFDMSSQYPFVLCTQKYPLGDSIPDGSQTIEDLDALVEHGFGFFADVEISYIKIKSEMISPVLSQDWHKIYKLDRRNLFFGSRVYESHTKFVHTLSSVEFQEMRKYFDMKLQVIYCERFKMSRLPKKFISTILNAYAEKTIFKGDEENETKYRLSKIFVNSIYGICGTSPLFKEKTLDMDQWEIRELTEPEKIEKNKREKPRKRFVDYRWAVFCTSYARSYLAKALAHIGIDVIYCDTDSVKFRNPDGKYDDFFERENEKILSELKTTAQSLGIFVERFMPEDKKGIVRPLGVWENESFEGEFYAKAPKDNHKLKKDRLEITSSGISSGALLGFYESQGLETPKQKFDFYKKTAPKLRIPPDLSGKLTHKIVDSRSLVGRKYRGDDGSVGAVQVEFSESLFKAPFEKIEKSFRNQLTREISYRIYAKMEVEYENDNLEGEVVR